MKFIECNLQDNRNNELFVVEGLSAADNLKRARNADTQAVFALQGKPINAAKATQKRVEQHLELKGLVQALGCGLGNHFKLQDIRYRHINLLFDPDADGIHCGALMQIFLIKLMPGLIQANKVSMVRAPLFEVTLTGKSQSVMAYSQQHFDKIVAYLAAENISYQTKHFKGVASLSVDQARSCCLSSETRKSTILTSEDAYVASRMFG